MPTIETVRIKHEDVPGGMVIEKKDFDPAVHQLYDAPADEAPKAKRGKKADAPADEAPKAKRGKKADAPADEA